MIKKPLTKKLFNDIKKNYFILISVEQLLYKYANVMQQIDSSSCGFFTITYAIDIAFGIDPKNPSVFITNATLVLKKNIKNIIIILGIF
jgi:hypothetical protein